MSEPTGIHSVAWVWPDLSADELADMADDIREIGLLHPIVLDQHGAIVDGVQSLRACFLADVEPRFETREFADDDAVGVYCWSLNGLRTIFNKGQRAVLYAMAGHSSHSPLLPQARVVVEHAPELAREVLHNAMPLTTATDTVNQRLAGRALLMVRMDEVRHKALALAALVDDERMDWTSAIAVYEQMAGLPSSQLQASPQPPPTMPSRRRSRRASRHSSASPASNATTDRIS